MSSSSQPITPHSLPEYCYPTERYLVDLSSAFNTCVPTNLALISSGLGLCSIIAWLFAQLPQIYKNYQLESAAGLSIFFLAEWLLGDLTNLLGAFLTKQASWQVILAAYYVSVDICLLSQYLWYSYARPWRRSRIIEWHPHDGDNLNDSEGVLEGVPAGTNGESSSEDQPTIKEENQFNEHSKGPVMSKRTNALTSDVSPSEKQLVPLAPSISPRYHHTSLGLPSQSSLLLTTFASITLAAALPKPLGPPVSIAAGIDPLGIVSSSASASEPVAESVGRVFSWISTACYLLSRIPQIVKNARRGSTSGLSASLFVAAFFGNFFYSVSVLCNPLAWSSYPPHGLFGWVGPEGSDRETWIALAAPFWLGAAGVLVMDAIIFTQFWILGGKDGEVAKEVLLVLEDDEDGQGAESDGGALPIAAAGRNRSRISTAEDGISGTGRGRTKWKKVTGWMRGWVPSPSREPISGSGIERVVSTGEERRSLLGRRRSADQGEAARDRSNYGTHNLQDSR